MIETYQSINNNFLGLTVLSPRQWKFVGGERWAGAALATFVQPEQPAVETLAAEALGLSGSANTQESLARRTIDR